MSLQARPFRGVRFDEKKFGLGRVVSPPYDVFTAELERKLRRRRENAVHLELPAGKSAGRYKKSRALWERWLRAGVLVRDEQPAFYVVEQRFGFRGRTYTRTGLMCALGLDAGTARRVLRHERTLPKHKADRTRVLKTMKANTSPIFGIYPDPGRRMRSAIDRVRKGSPRAIGKDVGGVSYRMWIVDDPTLIGRIERAFRTKKLLIADGHHRYEVAREYWRRTKEAGADGVLAYLVAEGDAGLIVNPTHRVVRPSPRVQRALEIRCAGMPAGNWRTLVRMLARAKSPYAFGLFNGDSRLMVPAKGDKGVPSRFGLDWLSRRILAGIDPHDIAYFHEAADAVRWAKRSGSLAFLGRPFTVADIRKAVERAGLMPQKSTYFFPKIGSGLVFRSF